MKQVIIAIAVALTSITSAHAFKRCPDDWKFRQDKQEHFYGSIAMAGTFNAVTNDPWKAFGASAVIGGTYELVTGCSSIQDFGYDVLGSAIGAYIGYKIKNVTIGPNRVLYEINLNLF